VNGIRFGVAVFLLAGTGTFLQFRGNEVLPARQAFISFPHQLGSWEGKDVDISNDVLDVLGPGDFLFRDYTDDSSSEPPVNLFIAYFPSQKFGDTMHSPKNCLPGAGWSPLEAARINISLSGGEPLAVNRYLVGKGTQRALVLYWYWAHKRAVASEYAARFYLVEDSIRLRRSDGSLIRVVTDLGSQDNVAGAQQRMISLLDNVMPALDPYVPR
jgi:EpsI family protein